MKCYNTDCAFFMRSEWCNCRGVRAKGTLYKTEEDKWEFLLKNLECDKRGIRKKLIIEIPDMQRFQNIEIETYLDKESTYGKTIQLTPDIIGYAHKDRDRGDGIVTTVIIERVNSYEVDCPDCNGGGIDFKAHSPTCNPCSTCDGTGRIEKNEETATECKD